MKQSLLKYLLTVVASTAILFSFAQEHHTTTHTTTSEAPAQHTDTLSAAGQTHAAHAAPTTDAHAHDATAAAGHDTHTEEAFNPTTAIPHHIADANEFHLWGNVSIPLPCILYNNETGLTTCLSSAFEHGHKSVNGYVLNHGRVNRVLGNFPTESVPVQISHDAEGKAVALYNNMQYPLEEPSTLTGMTNFYDFSITKNVFTMLLAATLMALIFFYMAGRYRKHPSSAPKGFIQSFFEVILYFLADEVIKPIVGPKYAKYLPYLYTLFFFIWFCNLLGLIPIFPGGGNVMGNLAVTMVLSLLTFFISLAVSNRHYWQHMLWMPGVPAPVKLLLTPIELVSNLIVKPVSLMIRLFANITAGHIIIMSLISLIFIFGESGKNLVGGTVGAVVAFFFVMFMNCIEFLVAGLQAFIFVVLSSLYIGTAIEEHHHHDDDPHHEPLLDHVNGGNLGDGHNLHKAH
jgi:F-type H+-transporting ATPase subunit a